LYCPPQERIWNIAGFGKIITKRGFAFFVTLRELRDLAVTLAALAEAEGTMIGTEKMDDAVIRATASSISERTKEIAGLLR
jgi:hypothetical protein